MHSYISLDILIEKWMEGMLYFPNLYKKKKINIYFFQDSPICSCIFFFKELYLDFLEDKLRDAARQIWQRSLQIWCTVACMTADDWR